MHRVPLIAALLVSMSCTGAPAEVPHDRPTLIAALPAESQTIWRAADHLLASSTALQRRADQLKHDTGIDRELIGLGAALQETSTALKRLEPILLKKQKADLSALTGNPVAMRAAAENLRLTIAFRKQLDQITTAGRELAALDPIGRVGPSRQACQALTDAGIALIELDESSGIGLHLRHTGEMLDTFREATARREQTMREQSARTLSQMIRLVGQNLVGSASVIAGLDGTRLIGGAFYFLSEDIQHPSRNDLDLALAVCEESFRELSASLLDRAATYRSLQLPGAAARYTEQLRSNGPFLERQAAVPRAAADKVKAARTILRAPGDFARALTTAGSLLLEGHTSDELEWAAKAMVEAGRRLSARNSTSAAALLRQTAIELQQGAGLAPP